MEHSTSGRASHAGVRRDFSVRPDALYEMANKLNQMASTAFEQRDFAVTYFPAPEAFIDTGGEEYARVAEAATTAFKRLGDSLLVSADLMRDSARAYEDTERRNMELAGVVDRQLRQPSTRPETELLDDPEAH